MLTKEELPACPVATTLQLIGSKWKILIIRNLMSRPWRFNELKRDLEGISQKVLTDSLRSMEEDGIITRTVYAEVPPRVEYALSDLGGVHAPHHHGNGRMGHRLQGVLFTGINHLFFYIQKRSIPISLRKCSFWNTISYLRILFANIWHKCYVTSSLDCYS